MSPSRKLAIALGGAATLAAAPAQAQQGGNTVAAPIVFFDIAGPDMASQSKFYSTVFGWEVAPTGSFTPPVMPARDKPGAVGAQLRSPDKADKVIYIGVDDVAATLAHIEANGGKVTAPRFEVPGVVVLGLFTDPAGNSMGLVEMENGRAVIP